MNVADCVTLYHHEFKTCYCAEHKLLLYVSMSRLTLGGKKRAGGRVHRDRRAEENDLVGPILGKR